MAPNGTAIRAIRQGKSLSLRDLAELAHCSAATLSRIERGVTQDPGEALLSRLAKALAVPVDDITQGGQMAATTAKEKVPPREVPYPGTPEGELFHYTPEEAAGFLPWSALQLRRKAYAREIPYNDGAKRVSFTGRDIREISEMTAVRPLSETTQRRSA
ncbi:MULTISPECIES: helix-turn-helix domain-containing protein [Streptomyces]|uniref:Transcriptional regulator with XRE-family HTH domain n=2 Tax=Streptomyces TaxID=1883 RepID=A0A8I0PAQ2_9ACTN|nr:MULTISPECIES: helix-turn-helix transcriptional regulator [Streptomyces]MBD9703428.1 helix-turn-helix transcriptional regulator [Streptomyces caniscabiei]MBE1599010.1 transcriptional regulator with XRE-family HTH domain [Streptomyces stelliscabiei]MDX3507414.1 helix-turn-helix transcriptional regulator [Streptomyces caniscabiei]MDX3726919.1 helix-turn-helix transcriptional regulator [Streptomyces caniscabiei]